MVESSFDKIVRGSCPSCGALTERLPRTIVGGSAGPGLRYAYENFDCAACGLRLSVLVRDRKPAGDA